MTRDDISSLAHFKWNCYIIIQPLISFGKMTIITKKVTFVTSSLYHISKQLFIPAFSATISSR